MSADSSIRTVRLREHMAREIRLAPDDVAFLLAHHRTHLELTPTARRHVYRVTSLGFVGVLTAPSCRFVLQPKIADTNFFQLLDPLGEYRSAPDAVTQVGDYAAMNFLAGQLARLLLKRGAAGLHQGYVEVEENGAFLRGKLDVAAQLRDSPARRDRLHTRSDSFTTDVPCNRFAKATAEQLLSSPFLDDTVRAQWRTSLRPFLEVTATLADCDTLPTTPQPEEYRPLLDLCRLLVGSVQHPGAKAGPVAAPGFLLDMQRIFERYCIASCSMSLNVGGEWSGAEQPLHRIDDLVMRPDLVVSKSGEPMLVVDAKWKMRVVPEDIYQVVAYCAALGARRGVLVYPGRRDDEREYHFDRTDIHLVIRKLRIVGPPERCQRSAQRLSQRILHHASATP